MSRFGTSLFFALVSIWAVQASAQAGLPHIFEADTPAIAEEVNENFRYVAPKNVIYVNADGTPEENGAALLAAAHWETYTRLNGPPSEDNPYLIKLRPGVYELESGLLLQNFVSLEGSGKRVTRIISHGANGIRLGRSSVRHLSLEFGSGGTGEVRGVYVNGNGAVVSNLLIEGKGDQLLGMELSPTGAARVDVEATEIYIDAATNGRGLHVGGGTPAHIHNLRIEIGGKAGRMIGLSDSGTARIVASDVVLVMDSQASAGQANYFYGIRAGGSGDKRFVSTWVELRMSSTSETFPLVTQSATGAGGKVVFEGGALLHNRGLSHPIVNLISGRAAVRVANTKVTTNGYVSTAGLGTLHCVYLHRDSDHFPYASCSTIVQ